MPTQPTIKPSAPLQVKLKASDPDVRAHVKHLESVNRKLQTQFVKFQSQHITDNNRIAALEKELEKELKKGRRPVISIRTFSEPKP